MSVPSYESINDELGWAHCYFVQGAMSPGYRVNELLSPPVTGWSHVVIRDGEKQCMIFDPYTLSTFTVSHRSMEYASLRTPKQAFRPGSMCKHLRAKWASYEELGFRGDFGMAAHIMRALGEEPPAIKSHLIEVDDFGDPIETNVARRGKVVQEELKKLVKRNSKRGKVLEWFLAEGGGPKSLQVCMETFKITRSNALSYLFMLNKDHGIGYVLGGNTATVQVPGDINPFSE